METHDMEKLPTARTSLAADLTIAVALNSVSIDVTLATMESIWIWADDK